MSKKGEAHAAYMVPTSRYTVPTSHYPPSPPPPRRLRRRRRRRRVWLTPSRAAVPAAPAAAPLAGSGTDGGAGERRRAPASASRRVARSRGTPSPSARSTRGGRRLPTTARSERRRAAEHFRVQSGMHRKYDKIMVVLFTGAPGELGPHSVPDKFPTSVQMSGVS